MLSLFQQAAKYLTLPLRLQELSFEDEFSLHKWNIKFTNRNILEQDECIPKFGEFER